MGMFVEYDVDGHTGQTKVWNDCADVRYLETYRTGDSVPALSRPGRPLDEETYSVILGYHDDAGKSGYMNVEKGIITGWSYHPEHMLVMNQYGDIVSETGTW